MVLDEGSIEFQGRHTNQAYYKSGIMPPEYRRNSNNAMHAFPLGRAISLHYNYNCITHAIRLERRRKMTKGSWTGDRALQIAETVLNGEITTTMDRLTPARILEIANAAVKKQRLRCVR